MIPECRHIRPNGTKCRAAALRTKPWCYFHNNHHRERPAAAVAAATLDHGHIPVPNDQKSFVLDLPFIEDLSSIQLAIARVLQALAMNQLDTKRAGLLLYGLQIAARNLPEHELYSHSTVTNVAHTPDGIPYDATGLPTPAAIPQALEEPDDEADDLEDEDEEDPEDEMEDEEEDITVSKPEYPQSLKDLQSFVARLRVAALHQGVDPAIVYGTHLKKANPAPAPTL